MCLNDQSVIFVFCTVKESTCAAPRPCLGCANTHSYLLLSPEPVNRLHLQSASDSSVTTTFLNKCSRVTREAYFSSLLLGLISPTRFHCSVNGSFCQHKAQTRNLIVLLMCYFLLESPLRNGACWLKLEENLGSERSQTSQGFT